MERRPTKEDMAADRRRAHQVLRDLFFMIDLRGEDGERMFENIRWASHCAEFVFLLTSAFVAFMQEETARRLQHDYRLDQALHQRVVMEAHKSTAVWGGLACLIDPQGCARATSGSMAWHPPIAARPVLPPPRVASPDQPIPGPSSAARPPPTPIKEEQLPPPTPIKEEQFKQGTQG